MMSDARVISKSVRPAKNLKARLAHFHLSRTLGMHSLVNLDKYQCLQGSPCSSPSWTCDNLCMGFDLSTPSTRTFQMRRPR
mmetsp:Transcript_29124/g.53617  ORF Transcript_29124/g.53617 Transcript_29124/m.53617 type:complete len:81 (+) Transcript_29124:1-243(+)